MVLGPVGIPRKTNEIPALCALADELDCAGRVVSADAMQAQQETAHHLVEKREADYSFTAVKDNQPTIWADFATMDCSDCPLYEGVDKGHGRVERSRNAAAISIIRRQGVFTPEPRAICHSSGNHQDALDLAWNRPAP